MPPDHGRHANTVLLNRLGQNGMSSQPTRTSCCEFFRQGYDDWHDTGQQVIDQGCAAKGSIPLAVHQNAEVIILGDAAHAVPLSSGQGVNQALEDVQSLILFLKSSSNLIETLHTWQGMSQTRMDAVFAWVANATNVERLLEPERNKLMVETKL